MYLTDDKKINYSINGSFYTRKWNDYLPYVYFEKVYGGHGLLKKAVNIAKQNNIEFHSSMIKENQVESWESAGWNVYKRLYVCDQNLKYLPKNTYQDLSSVSQKKLEVKDFSYLLDLDKNIFDSYWRNSKTSFHETLKSCVNNYLFLLREQGKLIGYAILGETRNLSYLQRIGVDINYQSLGYGKGLLQNVLNFAKKRNFYTIKLNTQETNESALSLYKKHGFIVQKNKLIIMTNA